ncbi:MAG: hypothetical protein VX346_10135 [Planctomycetota bacterium]|nr:hypothetical protein [Planctomycetota bacterium]
MMVLRTWCGVVLCLVFIGGCATVTGQRADSTGPMRSPGVAEGSQGSWYTGSWKWPQWGSAKAKPARTSKRPSMWQKMKRGTSRAWGRTKAALTPDPAPRVDPASSSVTDFLRQPKVMPDS